MKTDAGVVTVPYEARNPWTRDPPGRNFVCWISWNPSSRNCLVSSPASGKAYARIGTPYEGSSVRISKAVVKPLRR